jgi:hypothetical protein
VELNQSVFGTLIIVILLGMAGFFTWRQLRVLKRLRLDDGLSAEDRSYLRNQARRRLICSGLMVLLAGMLVTSFVLEKPLQELARQGEANRAQPEPQPLNPDQERFFNLYSGLWIVFLLILMVVMGLAAADIIAIRRYGQRHFRQIQEGRRAMIETQLARIRSQRNGHR